MKRKYHFSALNKLLLGLAIAGSGTTASAALVSLYVDAGTGHEYRLYSADTGITWTAARTAALSTGGDLASLTTSAELTAVTNGLTGWAFNSIGLGPWVGASSMGGPVNSRDPFKWLDGTSITTPDPNFWSAGQPDWADPTAGAAQGVLFYPNLTRFGDYGQACGAGLSGCGAGLVRGYVVELTAAQRQAVPEPSSLALVGLAIAALGFAGRKRA